MEGSSRNCFLLYALISLFYIFIITKVQCSSVIIRGSQPQYLLNHTFNDYSRCTPKLSVSLIIDVTESQFDKIEFAQKDLTLVLRQLNEKYPGSRFSLSTHTDKPVSPLGFNLPEWTDYCLRLRTVFEDSLEKSIDVLNTLYIAGGQDFFESSWDSLLRAAHTPELHWPQDGVVDSTPHIKILILVSDAFSHDAGDLKRAVQLDLNKAQVFLPNNISSALLINDINAHCDTMGYPTLQQVATTIKQKHYLPIIVTAPAHYKCGNNICPYPELIIKAKQTGNSIYADPIKGMEYYYTQAMKSMDVTGFVQAVADTPSEFANQFMRSLDSLINLDKICTPNEIIVPPTYPKLRDPIVPIPKTKEPCEVCGGICCSDIDIRINVTVT